MVQMSKQKSFIYKAILQLPHITFDFDDKTEGILSGGDTKSIQAC